MDVRTPRQKRSLRRALASSTWNGRPRVVHNYLSHRKIAGLVLDPRSSLTRTNAVPPPEQNIRKEEAAGIFRNPGIWYSAGRTISRDTRRRPPRTASYRTARQNRIISSAWPGNIFQPRGVRVGAAANGKSIYITAVALACRVLRSMLRSAKDTVPRMATWCTRRCSSPGRCPT